MTKRALLGLYTLASILALLGLFAVLGDFTTKLRGYRIGVRFPSAAGIHAGALVYESGVVVGGVDRVRVLPDYSTEVTLAMKSGVEVPGNARFMILQPLTGDATLAITPAERYGRVSSAPLPHRVLPVDEQPRGEATLSLPEFLAEGQTQFARLDVLMLDLQRRAPGLFGKLDRTLENANRLMVTANASVGRLGADAHTSLDAFNRSSVELTAQLSQSLAAASADVLSATARLNVSAQRGQPHLDHMFADLDRASRSLAASVDSLHAIAADPSIHDNIAKSTRSLADTSATFAALLNDFRQVTGNETSQAQLRDAVAHVDAAAQKADSFMGRFGRSRVAGVDTPAAPATPVPGPTSPYAAAPAAPPAPGAASGSGDATSGSTAGPGTGAGSTGRRLDGETPTRLFSVDLRESELSRPRRDAGGTTVVAPLLPADRGPQTDLTLDVLPDAATGYLFGVNDVGGVGTVTAAAVKHVGNASYGGGLLYSRLGVFGTVRAGPVGLETRVYDPRRGSVDVYGNLYASPHATIFAGERDATRATRRPVYGVDLRF